ncbi:hypothetical protein Pint_26075 [Pistacia integerrima]|uniref:Uncharacterized protein n=1 Tax=Pistacia integerrima TaxID=434235 RepID=A0ACC0YEA6_9ROSI|nr:hypothetical protein Pint_26075 [Pistacia integerrima]
MMEKPRVPSHWTQLPPLFSSIRESKNEQNQILIKKLTYRMEETAILTQGAAQAAGSLNFGTLQDEYKYLCAKKKDVEEELKTNILEMKRTQECDSWLKDVGRMEGKFETLKTKYDGTHRFLFGVCAFPALLKLGKEIVKMTEEVCSLKDRLRQVRRLMVDKPPASLMRMPAKKIDELPSLSSLVDKLKEYLSNAELKRICLWGILGVGKSTIMKNLNNAFDKEFDFVFLVEVNRDGDERLIQDKLLERLKIKATEQSDEQKAYMISEMLKNRRYLLLLDEVFSEIDLERIGMDEEHNGKVVFACRQKNICGWTDEDIKVRRLSDDDAQNLFWKTVRQNLKGNQEIRKEARKIITGHELYRDYEIECWKAEQFLTRFKKLWEARDRGHKILLDFVNKVFVGRGKEEGAVQNVRKSSLAEFPVSFFLHMDGLQLLDLHKTGIKFLPSSISRLINLKALFLNNCHQLMHLPSEVGSLHHLEIFDICSTGIYCLPTEIGQPTDLKCLKVSFTENGNVGNQNGVGARSREMISSNIIINLHSLEELSIEFPSMECFQNLINNSKSWNEGNLWKGDRVRSFKIHVGHQESNPLPDKLDVSECSVEKHLRLCRGEGFPVEVLKMLKQACVFELNGHRGAANLSSFSSENLEGLETCIIEDCREMTSIIDGNSRGGGTAYQRLNKLYVNSLPNLVHIWNGPMDSQSLLLLTTLILKECNSVKTLFSQEIVRQLKLLQYLQVENCQNIEEIIEAASSIEYEAFLKLKNLELVHLPRFSDICGDVSWPWRYLETIKIDTCEELKNFSFTFKEAAKLLVINCTQDLWNQLVWPNDTIKENFQRIHRLI